MLLSSGLTRVLWAFRCLHKSYTVQYYQTEAQKLAGADDEHMAL